MREYVIKHRIILTLCFTMLSAVGAFVPLFTPSQANQTTNSHNTIIDDSSRSVGRDQNVYHGVPFELHDRTTKQLGREEERNRLLERENRQLRERVKKLEFDLEKSDVDSEEINDLKAQALEALRAGDFNKTEKILIMAADRAQKDTASLISNIADIKLIQSQALDAATYYGQAADMAVGSERADYLTHQGTAFYEAGKCDQAKPVLMESLSIQEDLFGNASRKLLDNLRGLADCENAYGQMENAKEFLYRAESIERDYAPADGGDRGQQ